MTNFPLLNVLLEEKASSKVFELKDLIIDSITSISERLADDKYFPHKKYDTTKAKEEIENSDGYVKTGGFSETHAELRFDDQLRKMLESQIRFAISKWIHSDTIFAKPEYISIDNNEKHYHGAVGTHHYDDDQKVPQSKIPVKKFMVSGKFVTILFHQIVDELRSRPKPTKTTKEEVYIMRMNESILAAINDPTVNKELNIFCSIVVHEAQHLAQHKKGMHDRYFPNTQKNALGNKNNSFGEPINKLNYYAEYGEIDAYAVDLASKLLLDNVPKGAKANIRDLMLKANHAFYTDFDKNQLPNTNIEPIRQRFIKRVFNALNHYNDTLED